jgi:hypothetical protein
MKSQTEEKGSDLKLNIGIDFNREIDKGTQPSGQNKDVYYQTKTTKKTFKTFSVQKKLLFRYPSNR